jgi:hypothetical protein
MRVWTLVFAVGCLEHVSGEEVPLDPRFTEQAEVAGQGTDTGGPAHTEQEHAVVEHEEVDPPQPFADVEGDRVAVSGMIVSEVMLAVDLDVARKDESSAGGMKSEGKVLFAEPGPFEVQIPVSAGDIRLVAFQDPDEDGPGETDFYAELDVTVGTEPVTDLVITLVQGGRSSGATGSGPVHTEAPPGFGSGQAPPPDGQASDVDPFADIEGQRVEVSGTIVYEGEGVIDLDLFQPSESAPGGRKLLGKLKKSAGPFTLQVPRTLGALELDAFADQTGDGPSGDDPRGQLRGIDLTQGSVTGLQIALEALTEKAPEPLPEGGGTDLEEEFKRTATGGADRDRSRDGL